MVAVTGAGEKGLGMQRGPADSCYDPALIKLLKIQGIQIISLPFSLKIHHNSFLAFMLSSILASNLSTFVYL
jgi:hypothetical protein